MVLIQSKFENHQFPKLIFKVTEFLKILIKQSYCQDLLSLNCSGWLTTPCPDLHWSHVFNTLAIVFKKLAEWFLPLLNFFEWNLHLLGFDTHYLLPGLPVYSWSSLTFISLLLSYFCCCCFQVLIQIKIQSTSHTYSLCFLVIF